MARARANPTEVAGEPIEDILAGAAGLAITDFVNSQLAAPIIGQIGLNPGGVAGKAVDTLSTGASAWVVGEVGKMVDPKIGHWAKIGGLFLAGGKFLSIFIPGFSIGGSLPSGIRLPAIGQPAAKKPALPAASQAYVGTNPQVSPAFNTGV